MNSQLFSDDFNRANSNTIGTGWSQTVATAGSVQIISNAYFQQGGTAAPRDGFVLRTETFNNNQYFKAKFLTYSDSNSSNLANNGICVRGSGTLTSFTGYGFFPCNNGGATARLVKLVNSNLNAGPPTNITNLVTGLSVANNDIFELRANGTTISLLKNTVQVASVTDAAIASGKVGFVDPFATNFTINEQQTTTWDDASGGDILPDVVNVSVNVTGVGATGSPGSVTVQTSANPVLTGVAAVASPGIIAGGEPNVVLGGVAAIGGAGDLSINGTTDVLLDGVEALGIPGDVEATISIDVSVDGVAATGFAGEVLAGPKYTTPLHVSGHVLLEFSGTGQVC